MIRSADLPESVVLAMKAHVAAGYPREACGVVFEIARYGQVAYEPYACRNAAHDPAHRFLVHPRDLVVILRRCQMGDRLVAIYHSHVEHPATFSPRDREYAAAYPHALHLVFAVTARGVLAMHAYAADGTPQDAPVEVEA